MQTKVQKWGNSLAVRIPRSIAAAAHLEETGPVDLEVVDGKLVITAAPARAYVLADLLARVTDANLHGEVDLGRPFGAEEW